MKLDIKSFLCNKFQEITIIFLIFREKSVNIKCIYDHQNIKNKNINNYTEEICQYIVFVLQFINIPATIGSYYRCTYDVDEK